MSIERTASEILRDFSRYIDRVVDRDERFVILRGGRPVAQLAPLPRGACLGDLPGLLDSLPRLSPEEAKAFSADLDRARDPLLEHEPRSPWES